MQGFDEQFSDLPDFILKCTHRIWEGRDIAYLDWHYADDLLVRSPAGINRGNKAGKAATMATLAEFPDRQLLGEDVIWSGDEVAGFFSSHRNLSVATHQGGAFGVATGKRVKFRAIADTFCKDDRVQDEWLIRDSGAIALQLGTSPRDLAQAQIDSGELSKPLTPETDEAGPYSGRGNDNEWGARHAAILQSIMSSDFSTVSKEYDRACHLSAANGLEVHGWRDISDFWIGLRSALPSAVFRIDHQIGRTDAMLGPRSAIRWSLTGCHEGWGRYGQPTGAEIHIMGISHAEFGAYGLRREFTLFDDVAIWKQILRYALV